jgi:hypothetical protein
VVLSKIILGTPAMKVLGILLDTDKCSQVKLQVFIIFYYLLL